MRFFLMILAIALFNTTLYSQFFDLIITPSIDGCVYVDENNERMIIVDKLYSKVDLNINSSLELTESFLNKNEDNFSEVRTDYIYFLKEILIKDEYGEYTITEKTVLSETRPVIPKAAKLADFVPLNKTSLDYINCNNIGEEKHFNGTYEINSDVTLHVNNTSIPYNFIIVSKDCFLYAKEVFDNPNVFVSVQNSSLCLVHIETNLYIIQRRKTDK